MVEEPLASVGMALAVGPWALVVACKALVVAYMALGVEPWASVVAYMALGVVLGEQALEQVRVYIEVDFELELVLGMVVAPVLGTVVEQVQVCIEVVLELELGLDMVVELVLGMVAVPAVVLEYN